MAYEGVLVLESFTRIRMGFCADFGTLWLQYPHRILKSIREVSSSGKSVDLNKTPLV
jgi:hypothetical protein